MWGISTNILKAGIYLFGSVIFLLCIDWLPQMASTSANIYPEYAHLKYPVLLGMYVTTIPFYFALYQALAFIKTIETKKAAVTVKSLSIIKACAITIIILYSIGFAFLTSQHAMHPGIALLGLLIMLITFAVARISAMLQKQYSI
ncbi:DUF2975 domain-containing protein [Lysinibacillus sp. KU-BSD001]|uniref:DUF2975 domain-containing protein n=1 Tax=Lysinibacillus sp. KU-BSD001 TaxID=3141328 RepID=UPI0036EDF4BD